ncbi:MAG TPA: GNAT family N-acetyltransferase [Candidatus Eisenbacteria bacterium]|nr:GNAT family N-acetyltransferase [Candidatus Eisenbacteria bacterium]
MMPETEIAEVKTLAELEHVRKLLRSYQAELPAQCRFADAEWQNLPGAYSAPGGTLLLATVSGQPAGCVGLRTFPLVGTCEMKRLYVAPIFRGRQTGRALVERVISIARQLGYTRMRLDTHPLTMGAAVALYRHVGFVEVPAFPVEAVEDLLYMQLPL